MREPFDSATTYHLYNRGVDHRRIFQSEDDFRRFYESLYLFNDAHFERISGQEISRDLQLAAHSALEIDRVPLVQIQAFCLRPNHYHLLVRQHAAGGISKFLHRLAMGYTKYFNKKYERTGRLFESSYKLKPADWEEHEDLLIRYVHLNALDGSDFAWRTNGEIDWTSAMALLSGYQWSSHHTYMRSPQLLPVIDEQFVQQRFPNAESYAAYLTAGVSR